MRWSAPLGTIAGTTLRLHATFPLLLIWVAALHAREGGWPAALDAVAFVLLVFLCVVLHEFGHVVAARRYGIRTPDITLLPIGGLARLERMPEKPGREIFVALAGPAVNVVLALALFLALGARFDLQDMAQIEAAQMSMTGRLAAVNVLLVLFNMIPAFPTDGGRVLRALLAFRMGRVRATRIAATAGQGFAALFVVVGLLGNPFLALIGVFLFLAGSAETRDVEQQATAKGRLVRDALIARFESLGPASTAQDAARLLLATAQREFPVLDGAGRLLGVVTREGLVAALSEGGPQTPVSRFMVADPPVLAPDAPLSAALDALRDGKAPLAAAADRAGRFVGYVNRENLLELFLLADAAEKEERSDARR